MSEKTNSKAKLCRLSFGKKRLFALVDSGADISLITSHVLKSLPRDCVTTIRDTSIHVSGVTGKSLSILGAVKLNFSIGKSSLSHVFYVVKEMTKPAILGADFLSAVGAKLDYGGKTLAIGKTVVLLKDKALLRYESDECMLVRAKKASKVPPRSATFVSVAGKLPKGVSIITPLDNCPLLEDQPGLTMPNVITDQASNVKHSVLLVNDTNRMFKVQKGEVLGLAEPLQEAEVLSFDYDANHYENQKCSDEPDKNVLNKIQLNHIEEQQASKLHSLLKNYQDIFAEKDSQLGRTSVVKMTLDTGDTTPIRQRPYRTPFALRNVVDEHLNEMLAANVIRPSTSPWASPIVMVDKKDGSKRFCVDFRRLNQAIVKNSYPLPLIDDVLSSLGDAKIFSCLDLKSGYWQIEMAEEDRCKTAFVCHKGLYEFNVLPFGLCTAPPVFQDLMNRVLGDIQNKFTIAYLDDIIIYSKTFEEHIHHLDIVLNKLKGAGLKIKPSKCSFLKNSVHYLGHVISNQGIEPDPDKIKIIRELKPPQTVRQVRSLVGMASYYRRFIPNFSDIARPLTLLTHKHARFLWGHDQQKAFEELKIKLTTSPVLAHPILNKPYKLYTDASQYAVGAVLAQDIGDGERVIQYLSKQLTEGQQKWPTIEREGYAIVYAINKLRHYLLGAKFTVYTDHKPLRTLFSSEMKNVRIQRWAIMLEEYGCDIEYKTGKTNIPADTLSRVVEKGVCVVDSSNSENLKQSDNILKDLDDEKININLIKDNKQLIKLQKEDRYLGPIIQGIEEGEDNKEFIVEDDLLYHLSSPVRHDSTCRLQLAIPQCMSEGVIVQLHDNIMGGGHVGLDKTYDKIRSRYYWPNMYRDVVAHLEKCELCQARKMKQKLAPLQDMPEAKFPFDIVGIDTCGPFPETMMGNKYILTIVDHFSSWPEAYAIPNKSANTVARILLEDFIPRHGCPRLLLSDRGTEFLNHVIELLTDKFKIGHIKTSPYHPQTNGKTERFHRFLNDTLAKYTYQNQTIWDTYVPGMLMAYRTSVNDSTKHTPFFLLHGRDPILPMDTLLQPKLKYMGDEYVPTMLQRLHKAFDDTRSNMKQARERNKRLYDRRASESNFEEGDPVYYHDITNTPGMSDKLNIKWKPFYRIVEKTSPVNYRIRHQITGKSKNVHVSKLRAAHPDTVWDEDREDYESLIPDRDDETEPVRRQPLRRAKLVSPSNQASEPVDDDEWSEDDDIPLARLRGMGPMLEDFKHSLKSETSDDREPNEHNIKNDRLEGVSFPRKRKREVVTQDRSDIKRYRQGTEDTESNMEISEISLTELIRKPLHGILKFLGITRD